MHLGLDLWYECVTQLQGLRPHVHTLHRLPIFFIFQGEYVAYVKEKQKKIKSTQQLISPPFELLFS